jgi:hypothetical protein
MNEEDKKEMERLINELKEEIVKYEAGEITPEQLTLAVEAIGEEMAIVANC